MTERAGMRQWGRILCVVTPMLTVALVGFGCAGRHGSLRFDTGVIKTFEDAQVLPGHRYYTTGSETEPSAIVALREERPLRGPWRPIRATPELLAALADAMRGTRLAGPEGAAILDDRGGRIGVWYSYRRYPAPPRLLDDGGVELGPPSGASGDDAPGRLLPRD